MKTLQQMLRELARADVAEFAVVSDRLPCIKVGGKYEPVDENARSTEAILEMLVSVGRQPLRGGLSEPSRRVDRCALDGARHRSACRPSCATGASRRASS